ncbi:amino acid permease [Chiua virens]|nr:amino acid permease [Chiua virens]
MASDEGSNEKKLGYDVNLQAVEGGEDSPQTHTTLHRKLQNRHVAMISIGGVIGTGLFLGTASSLMNGGPIGLLLGYLFVGTICFAVMLSLGEMIAFLPLPGGFIKLAERYIDPAYAFATGWNYWYGWTLTLPAELSAAATVISYWDKKTSPGVYITVCLVVAIGINLLGVRAYGEAEFWFSTIKVLTITGMIILGIVVDLGGGPNHDRIGFRYWKNPGPFTDYYGFTGPKGHFLGTCSVATQAAFSYLGTEAVAIAAAEARNPRRNIPKAIRRVYFRVLVFYIGGVLIIGLLVPSNNPLLNLNSNNASASPFVIAFNEAGIKILPSIINAAYSKRCMVRCAPKIFSYTTRSGLPYVAVGICCCFSFLAYMTLGQSSGIVFTWLSNFSATAGLVTWFGIGLTYIRFYKGLKAQGIDRKSLPFAPNVQPYAGWWAVCGSAFVLFFSAWEVFLKGNWSTATFVTDYFPIMFFPVLYIGARLVMRTRTIRPEEMDFVTNVAEFDAMTYDDPPPKNKLEAFWMWLM